VTANRRLRQLPAANPRPLPTPHTITNSCLPYHQPYLRIWVRPADTASLMRPSACRQASSDRPSHTLARHEFRRGGFRLKCEKSTADPNGLRFIVRRAGPSGATQRWSPTRTRTGCHPWVVDAEIALSYHSAGPRVHTNDDPFRQYDPHSAAISR
jgi:hypothetical protein